MVCPVILPSENFMPLRLCGVPFVNPLTPTAAVTPLLFFLVFKLGSQGVLLERLSGKMFVYILCGRIKDLPVEEQLG